MDESKTYGPLHNRRIALPETRQAERLALMLREQGAETLGCPLVAIVDFVDPAPVHAWLHQDIPHASGRDEKLRAALQKTVVAAIVPIVSGELARHGVAAAIMPTGAYLMKPMVSAIVAAISR
jgi:uroporphyrinogen-III synthase